MSVYFVAQQFGTFDLHRINLIMSKNLSVSVILLKPLTTPIYILNRMQISLKNSKPKQIFQAF